MLVMSSATAFSQKTGHVFYDTKAFQIEFPGQFEKSTQTIPSSIGQLTMTIISYEPKETYNDSNYVYMIMETDYPDSTIHSDKEAILEDFFRASIDGAVKNVNGKLLRESEDKVAGYPARTIEVDYQNGVAVIKMTMVLKENKMIIIQTITSTKNYPNNSSLHFFDSFKLR